MLLAAVVCFLLLIESTVSQCSEEDIDCETRSGGLINGPALEQNFIYPCVSNKSTAKLFNTVVWVVYNNYTYCTNEYRRFPVLSVTTNSSSANITQPLVFVTRSDKDVQTWHLPQRQLKFNTDVHSFTRTICSTVFRDRNTIQEDIAMYIDVFTSYPNSIDYEIIVEPVHNFELNISEPYNFNVAINAPQIRYFKFPRNSNSVLVTAESDSGGCVIVSVQDGRCPVNDLLENARSSGVFQTMITDATLTIKAHETVEGDDFFIVLVVSNISVCQDPSRNLKSTTARYNSVYSINVTLTIKPTHSASEYVVAIIIPIFVFLAIGVLVAVTFMFPCFNCIWRPVCNRGCLQFKEKVEDADDYIYIDEETNLRQVSANSGYGIDDSQQLDENTDTNHDFMKSGSDRELLVKSASSIKAPDLLKKPLPLLEQQYSVYGWNTITVGIFYALPAFQLMISQQIVLNASGNQDICYYNFKCSKPLGALSTFNAVWSNIGYVLLGLSFIAIVAIRQYKYKQLKENNSEKFYNYGLPKFFGIYYAMGVALIMEGFMSSFYHICPTDGNFQFDTAFMFIIGGLLIVKIFQARHPDVHTNAFIAFFCFAIVIFLTLIGIYEQYSIYWVTRAVLFVTVIVTILIFTVSFYFYHDWKLSNWIELKTYVRIWAWFRSWCVPCTSKENCLNFKPKHALRFVKMLITVVANIVIGVIMIVVNKGVATIILALFISNFLIFTAVYLLSKLWYREPWTMKPLIYIVILGVCWIVAFYFYFNNVAQWESSPAVSRAKNKNCIILGFYDNHDVWHFISATALFFSFLFVLTLDDGLNVKRRQNINVF